MTYRPGTRGIPRASFDRATKRVLLPPNAMILKEIKCLTPCCGRDTLVIQTCIAMILTNKKRRAYTKQRRVEAQLSRKIDYFKKIALANERMEYWKRILDVSARHYAEFYKKESPKNPLLTKQNLKAGYWMTGETRYTFDYVQKQYSRRKAELDFLIHLEIEQNERLQINAV